MKSYKVTREILKFNPSVKGMYETTEKGVLKSNLTLNQAKDYLAELRKRAKRIRTFDGVTQSGRVLQVHRLDKMFMFKIV